MFVFSSLRRSLLLVLSTSAILAGAATWLSLSAQGQPAEASRPVAKSSDQSQGVAILVASEAIPKGTQLAPDMIGTLVMQLGVSSDDLLVASDEHRNQLASIEAGRMIPKGTPFVADDLIYSSQDASPFAAMRATDSLGSGMRAVSVALSRNAAASGMIEPGDRIDVLVSFAMPDGNRAVRTVLANVRVVAMNDEGVQSPGGRTLTLELHPEGAKILALAQQTGDLIFALSPPNGGGAPRIVEDAPVVSSQISGAPAKISPVPPQPHRVTIIRGQGGGAAPASLP